jgi:hypothetical protein
VGRAPLHDLVEEVARIWKWFAPSHPEST